MSNPKQPPLGEVDPSEREGSIDERGDRQRAQASDAEAQDAAGLEVDPSEQPSSE